MATDTLAYKLQFWKFEVISLLPSWWVALKIDPPGEFEITTPLPLAQAALETSAIALCSITLFTDWEVLMPVVRCHEKWMRNEIDFHVNSDGTLCWDHPLRWSFKLKQIINDQGRWVARKYAALWCINSVKNLIYKHRFAYEQNIRFWQSDWSQYSHGSTGTREFFETEGKLSLYRIPGWSDF